ncbi:MAG: YbaN family protein [Phenylobacterium sp.]|uniref:YbaN family protein n=1 Tax=Phenylobacterium sp. TaxID=1871053 RepID=UPI0027360F8F|nr:YbaN family protein [Phenylobacterium sp.]MDP1643351.1 YbaN family protein [Phenylobacterium sp.]MDP3118541.1 YbaN family protein [Phenylobacterium sp.]MDP3384039.1 YbaN family protein [Phenylobacterium sp.]
MSAPSDPAAAPEDESQAPPAIAPVSALFYRALGFAALGLGIVGAFLPLLPTTIFLIIAAWAFGKSAPKLRARLYAHKRFGPTLRAWDRHGAIPPRAKLAAVIGMGLSLVVVMLTAANPWVPMGVGVVLTFCALYVLTRPSA